MKKRLSVVVVMVVLLVVASVAAVSTPSQNVHVNAPYLLNRIDSGSSVTVTFTMSGYTTGYVDRTNAIRLQVGAPGPWTVGVSASGGGFGVVNALYAKATGWSWVDVSASNQALLNGSNGEHNFYVDYRVIAAELSGTSGQNVSATVLVTYSFI